MKSADSTATASIAAALAQHRAFGQLPSAVRHSFAAQFAYEKCAAHAVLVARDQQTLRMGLILGGTVEAQDPERGLALGLHPGELFGFGAMPAQPVRHWQWVAHTDCEIAWLGADALEQLCAQHAPLLYFFPALEARTRAAPTRQIGESGASLNLLMTPIRTLLKREPITLAPDTTVQATALLMREQRVSSVMLVEQGLLFGLVTDRDLRNRVVAQGLDGQRPVSDIATLAPMTVDANSPAFEALLLMARHNIHHMPVMDGQRILGMITTTDLTEQHSTSAVYLAGDIYKQTSLEGLTRISARVRQLQLHLAAADASAYSTGHIVTTIVDALTTRLIHLATQQLGPAPVDYVWVAAGSQARSEQTAKSDQDNCLILDDCFDEARHGTYFKAFSKWVCDGLAACGYVHCPGAMMAMTDIWRQPRHVWVDYFHKWIDQPKPKALMLTCVFFDLRAIYGKVDLLDRLRQDIVQLTRGNSLFLAHMVGNALKHRPPLGMFGQLSPIRGGANAHTIDLKHTGIVPIVDLARVYALAAGVPHANTHDRLEMSSQAGEVSPQSARDLRDALEFLGKLRIAHQARQITQGRDPDNFLALDELSNFERSQLKDAFAVVRTLQEVLQQRYSGGQF